MMYARRGFLRPNDFNSDTMYADLMSKSSSFLPSIYFFMYSMRFWSYLLPNYRVMLLNNYLAVFYFISITYYFLAPFLWCCYSILCSNSLFLSFFYSFPEAMFLAIGGFFKIYAVSLCLLSSYPVNGHESHFPVIKLFTTIMCI